MLCGRDILPTSRFGMLAMGAEKNAGAGDSNALKRREFLELPVARHKNVHGCRYGDGKDEIIFWVRGHAGDDDGKRCPRRVISERCHKCMAEIVTDSSREIWLGERPLDFGDQLVTSDEFKGPCSPGP